MVTEKTEFLYMYMYFVPPPLATELLTLWALMQYSCISQLKATQQQLQTAVPLQRILTQFIRYQSELLTKYKKVFKRHQQFVCVNASSLWHKHAAGYWMPVSLNGSRSWTVFPLGTTIAGDICFQSVGPLSHITFKIFEIAEKNAKS